MNLKSTAKTSVLDGKSILITGGTGSFGKAFVKKALESKARRIVVFSRDEQKHYEMSRTMTDKRLRFFVGDIRDRDRLMSAFRDVDIVIHAAAMKHVPICEYNPIEAVQTNVNGAKNIIEAAIACGVKQVLGLSTDKAVAPANLYGATKLCMEKLLIAANAYSGEQWTQFSLVRYGNVMGSAGSVIPLFRNQQKNGLVTITDARMTRFWIEMEEAVALVLRGLELMNGGEIFIPKLPTSDIETLAEAVAPGTPRTVVGIRPGEKLHETLIGAEEARRTSDCDDVLVIWPEFTFNSKTQTAIRPGKPVPDGFEYSSDSALPRLDLDATREMVARVA
jgi:UDP-N-acetylglucosamine 4,6-dehydratase/5-epimerase